MLLRKSKEYNRKCIKKTLLKNKNNLIKLNRLEAVCSLTVSIHPLNIMQPTPISTSSLYSVKFQNLKEKEVRALKWEREWFKFLLMKKYHLHELLQN